MLQTPSIIIFIEMKNHIYSIGLVLFVLGCNSNSIKTNNSIEMPEQEDTIGLPKLSYDTVFDFSKAKRFQSFNEQKLIGYGKIINSPFVYVITDKDTVYVRQNEDNKTFKYVKENGYIHNRISFDMRKVDAMPIKSSDYKYARIYDRYIFTDTILELKHVYSGDNNSVTFSSTSLFIKDGQSCVVINLSSNEKLRIHNIESPIEEMRKIVSIYSSNKDKIKATKYILKQDNSYYYYVCPVRTSAPPFTDDSRVLDSIVYRKTSLGVYGLEPGLFETNIEVKQR